MARRCREAVFVDQAVLLAGTNDCLMHMALRQGNQGMLRLYRRLNGLLDSYAPSLERFEQEFRKLRPGRDGRYGS